MNLIRWPSLRIPISPVIEFMSKNSKDTKKIPRVEPYGNTSALWDHRKNNWNSNLSNRTLNFGPTIRTHKRARSRNKLAYLNTWSHCNIWYRCSHERFAYSRLRYTPKGFELLAGASNGSHISNIHWTTTQGTTTEEIYHVISGLSRYNMQFKNCRYSTITPMDKIKF